MLKAVFVNDKRIPVPVPVRTFEEAVTWVEDTLVPQGHTITRIQLDGEVVDEEACENPDFAKAPLAGNNTLELKVDSPFDLAIQTLDAMRNLASVLVSSLKPLAVQCWQAKPVDRPEGMDAILEDGEMILELLDHLNGLVDPNVKEAAAVQGLSGLVKKTLMSLEMAVSNSDWRACARILLNRLEPYVNDLVAETETLQTNVLEQNPDRTKAPTG